MECLHENICKLIFFKKVFPKSENAATFHISGSGGRQGGERQMIFGTPVEDNQGHILLSFQENPDYSSGARQGQSDPFTPCISNGGHGCTSGDDPYGCLGMVAG